MAIPVLIGQSNSGGTNVTSLSASISGHSSGDYLIAVLANRNNQGASFTATQSGWTLLQEVLSGSVCGAVFGKLSDGSETAVEINSNVAGRCCLAVFKNTGVASSSTVDASSEDETNTFSDVTSTGVGSANSSADGTAFTAIMCRDYNNWGSGDTVSISDSYTIVGSGYGDTGSTLRPRIHIAYKDYTGSTTQAPTWSTTDSSGGDVYGVIVLLKAAASGSNVSVSAALKGPTVAITAYEEPNVTVAATLKGPTATVTADEERDVSVAASLKGPTVSITASSTEPDVSITATLKGPTVKVIQSNTYKYQYRWNGTYQGTAEEDFITEVLVSALPDPENPTHDRSGWWPGDSGQVEVRAVDSLDVAGPWSSPIAYEIPAEHSISAALKGPTASIVAASEATASLIGVIKGPTVSATLDSEVGASVAASIKGPTVSVTLDNPVDISVAASLKGPSVTVLAGTETQVLISAALKGPTASITSPPIVETSIGASLKGPTASVTAVPETIVVSVSAALKGPTVALVADSEVESSLIGTLKGPTVSATIEGVPDTTIAATLKGPTATVTAASSVGVAIAATLKGPTVALNVLPPANASIIATLKGPTTAVVALPDTSVSSGTGSGKIGFNNAAAFYGGGWNSNVLEYQREVDANTVDIYFGVRMKNVWILFDQQSVTGSLTVKFKTSYNDVVWKNVENNTFDMSDTIGIRGVGSVMATGIRLIPTSIVGGPVIIRVLAETSGGF